MTVEVVLILEIFWTVHIFSWLLHKGMCWIPLNQINHIRILFSSEIVAFGITEAKERRIIFDKRKLQIFLFNLNGKISHSSQVKNSFNFNKFHETFIVFILIT